MAYPPQGTPVGVTTFLELTDTPADYTGHAGKSAVVNSAENALEFRGIGGASILTEEDYLLFDGTAPTSWTDLQIADASGNKPEGLALLEFRCLVTADRTWFVRRNGETLDCTAYAAHCCVTNDGADNSRLGYVLVPCDENGLIEWRCSDAATDVQVRLRGFIANVNWVGSPGVGQLVYSGVAPTTWTGISLGTGAALAILRVIDNSSGGPHVCIFRRYGDTTAWGATPSGGSHSGISRAHANQNNFNYLFVPTDQYGQIEWGDTDQRDWSIYLLGYIANVTYWDIEVYNATTLDQGLGSEYYQTIDLPVTGRCLAIFKSEGSGATFGVALRTTGVTTEFPYDYSPGFQNATVYPGYLGMLTNSYGQVDLSSRGAESNRLWLNLTIP